MVAAMAALAGLVLPAAAQDPAPPVNQPDMVAWQLFTQVNRYAATPGNNNALFETWASDPDTFTDNPVWPSAGATPKALIASVLAHGKSVARARVAVAPPVSSCAANWQPGNPPCIGEEVRRNRPAFDFIVQNNLYTAAGLVAAFGTPLSFPIDAIEVKADWIPVAELPSWNGTDPNQVNALYHVNTVPDPNGNPVGYALVAMHLISKQVPNWTWATFEHWKNPGRCDLIGCSDNFGAVVPQVAPNPQPNQGYPLCAKTGALLAMFSGAGLSALWQNYCLKGTQTDFTTATGVTTLLGNSVIEGLNAGVPVNQSSCMTCHATAAFNAQAQPLSVGLTSNQVGVPQPAWFGQGPTAYQQSDFVWAIPLCAVPTGGKSPCAP
jgi:hypothetical protein